MVGISLPWPQEMELTTSIGCAPLGALTNFETALGKADRALYLAKQSGRNCWKLAA